MLCRFYSILLSRSQMKKIHPTPINPISNSKKNNFFDVAVLGLGFSGAFTTDELCTAGMRVVAIDANDSVLGNNSTSRNECFKLHTGVHYIGNLETAIMCLRNSVAVAHYFGDLILDKNDPAAPSRRGRHYLMSNSLFSVEHVKSVCSALQTEYQRLLEAFPNAKKIFGEPENFIQYLNRKDYSYVADNIKFIDERKKTVSTNVVLGIETPECQIDFEAFRAYFKAIFTHHHNKHGLVLLLGHTIDQLSIDESALGYVVKTNYFDHEIKQRRSQTVTARCIINCTWNNIESLNRQLGFVYEGDRVNRIKVMIKVPLMPSLQKINTCIFFVGPHASITNIYDNQGKHQAILTYEPVTNAGFYKCGTPPHRRPAHLKKLEDKKLLPNEGIGLEYSQAILKGVSKYIPAFQWGEPPTEVSIGYVKNCFSPETNYLYHRESKHHSRMEEGVEIYDVGFIAFSGMKMTYTYRVSEEVTELVYHHLLVQKLLEIVMSSAYNELSKKNFSHVIFLKTIKCALLFHMRRDIMARFDIDIHDPQKYNLKRIKTLLDIFNQNLGFGKKIIDDLASTYNKKLITSYSHNRAFHLYASKVHSPPPNKLTPLKQRFKNNSTPYQADAMMIFSKL